MTQGLYHKYNIERVEEGNGEAEAHKHCDFFVLDLTHDVNAIQALEFYRDAMLKVDVKLAADLTHLLYRYCPCIDGQEPAPECPIHGEAAPQ